MITKKSIMESRMFLPLAIGSVRSRDIAIMVIKWGKNEAGTDIMSSKEVMTKVDVDCDIETLRNKERDVIIAIDAAVSQLFRCNNCGHDLRKNGVSRESRETVMSHDYIGPLGGVTRSVDAKTSVQSVKLLCAECSHVIHPLLANLMLPQREYGSSDIIKIAQELHNHNISPIIEPLKHVNLRVH